MKTKISHTYENFNEENRLQDTYLDGTDLTFTTLEHGGEFPDCMPQAIEVKDSHGRSAIYVLPLEGGKAVKSLGYNTERIED